VTREEMFEKLGEFRRSEYGRFLDLFRKIVYRNYWSTHSKKWHKDAIRTPFSEQQARALHKYLLPFLPKDRKVSILDAGCGYGSLVAFLRSQGYSRVEGIDISVEHIELAAALGIEGVKQADIFEFLEGVSEKYDVVTLIEVLEHQTVIEGLYLLYLVWRALRPGGRVIITVPNAVAWFPMSPYNDVSHMTYFSRSSFEQMLRVAGFKKVVIRERIPIVHGVKSFIRYMMWLGFKLFCWTFVLARTAQKRPPFLSDGVIACAFKGGDHDKESD